MFCSRRLCHGGVLGVVVVYAQSPSVVIVGYRCHRFRSTYFSVANRHRPITVARARYIFSSDPVSVIVHHKVVRIVSGVCISGIRRRGRRGRRHCRDDLRRYTTTVVVESTNTTSGRHPVHEPDSLVKHVHEVSNWKEAISM
ncbi:hypothetical protein QTP88_013520 [Uroleucon formosanum]